MRLLSISFTGLKMFYDGEFRLDFYASDRVPSDDEGVYELKKPLYTNKVIALAGINASGKTSALQLIRLAILIINGRSIDNPSLSSSFDLFQGDISFRAVFWDGGHIWLLESQLVESCNISEEFDGESYVFCRERIYHCLAKDVSKKDLSNLEDLSRKSRLIIERNEFDKFGDDWFISPVMSIIASFEEVTVAPLASLGAGDSHFQLRDPFAVDETLRLFDSNIEYMKRIPGDNVIYELKLKNDQEPLLLDNRGLVSVLSSGTIRGLEIVKSMLFVLDRGGYLLLDEIDNHLNKQLVKVIIDIFASDETNPLGATIVFTTHYSELLDNVRRKDNTYFLVRNDCSKTKMVKYSSAIKRIENKKSEVFMSDYIEGTAPRYSDIDILTSLIKNHVHREDYE